MAPPAFTSIGSTAKSIFCNAGYNYGSVKINAKAKSQNGFQVNGRSSTNLKSMKMDGNLESTYKVKSGFSLTSKLSSDQKVSGSASLESPFVPEGGKVVLNGSFSPLIRQPSADVKTSYKTDNMHLTWDSNLAFSRPTFLFSIVVGRGNYLAGYQGCADTKNSTVLKNNLVFGYQASDFHVTVNSHDSTKLGVSFFRKLDKFASMAAQLAWDRRNRQDGLQLGVAGTYNINGETKVGCKLNNNGQIGITSTRKISSHFSVTVSSLIEAAKNSSSDHKIGVGLDFSF